MGRLGLAARRRAESGGLSPWRRGRPEACRGARTVTVEGALPAARWERLDESSQVVPSSIHARRLHRLWGGAHAVLRTEPGVFGAGCRILAREGPGAHRTHRACRACASAGRHGVAGGPGVLRPGPGIPLRLPVDLCRTLVPRGPSFRSRARNGGTWLGEGVPGSAAIRGSGEMAPRRREARRGQGCITRHARLDPVGKAPTHRGPGRRRRAGARARRVPPSHR